MKILHTSDLHLGNSWYRLDRRRDEERVLTYILQLCEERAVDVLLVTGDIFSDRPRGSLAAVARRFLRQLAPAMQRGLRIVLLRGNHDSLELFQLLRYLLEEIASEHSSRLVFADVPDIYRISESDLQIVALPYVTPVMIEQAAAGSNIGADERVVNLTGKLVHLLQRLYSQADPRCRAIFAGHIAVRGAQITPEHEYESGYHRELWIDAASLPQFTSYNALGHIHLAQPLPHAGKPSWYAGSPDRHDLGEQAYRPSVMLVELSGSPGGTAEVERIEVPCCTPFVQRTLASVADVRAFCDEVRGQDPLGKVLLDVPFADRAECDARLREAASRLEIDYQTDDLVSFELEDSIDPLDVASTVHDFVERHYVGEKRARLLAGFDHLWQEAGA